MTSVDWGQVEALSRTNVGAYSAPQPDVLAQNALRARYAALVQVAPALVTVWPMLDLFHQPVTPLDRKSLEPVGDPVASLPAALDWWDERPRDAAGVLTGPQGSSTLVGVEVATNQAWRRFIESKASGAVIVHQRGGGETSTREEKELRFHGRPGSIAWQPPAPPSDMWSSGVRRGSDADFYKGADVLRDRVAASDRGGWLIFRVLADEAGKLPRFKTKRLADGVTALPDGAVVPVWTSTSDGWQTRLTGWPDSTEECATPAWFAAVLGAK